MTSVVFVEVEGVEGDTIIYVYSLYVFMTMYSYYIYRYVVILCPYYPTTSEKNHWHHQVKQKLQRHSWAVRGCCATCALDPT